jgi:hypothetical protein
MIMKTRVGEYVWEAKVQTQMGRPPQTMRTIALTYVIARDYFKTFGRILGTGPIRKEMI